MESAPVPATAGPPAALPPIAPLFDGDLELDALERMLLEAAVHPDGAGGERAWLLLWDARRGLLEGWRLAVRGPELDFAAALGRARRTAPGGDDERLPRAWAESPEALEGVLAEAWSGSTLACGDEPAAAAAPWSGAGRLGALALRRGPRAYGMIVAAWDAGSAGAVHVPARLEWLRGVADAALGAQWRGAEARRRAKHAEALAEMARAGVSAINVAEALHLLARLAAQATASRGAAVYRARGGEPRVEVAFGPAVLRDAFAAGFAGAARAAIESLQSHVADGPEEAPGLPAGVAGETSVWAALPLAAHDRAFGALVVYDGLERHPSAAAFDRADAAFLGVLADEAALLLEQADGADVLRGAERRVAEQEARLLEMDRMASVGELAARVARESRNPIASISAFARRAQRELGEDDPQREYLEIVVREAERLEAMLHEQLQYAQLERPRLRMQSLNVVVQEALARASETLVRRRVRLLKRLAADLPELLLDEHRIRRVLENVVAFALETVSTGGRIKVESRRAGDWVAVEVAHDGSRSGGDLLEQLFVPFAAGVHGGAAVGLGVAQQIVREHGGEVRVRSEGEWATVFSFTLPIHGNEDRRLGTDRRSVRGERRRRAGDAPGGEAGV